MQIFIMSSEKDRIGLGQNRGYSKTAEEFGLTFQYCDVEHSTDLLNLTWRYKVLDEKKFMLICIKHGLKYRKYIPKGSQEYADL